MNINKERQASGTPSTALTRLVSILLIIVAVSIPLLLILHEIGSFEQLLANAALEPLFRQMLIAGIVAWMIWLVWLAISLLIGTSGTSKPESHRLVQEREDLSAKRREA
jgi:lysylphosphatidylglycerol synthetase-like protein (DUF2156 family)